MPDTISCCALSSVLEDSLPTLSGVEFKLLFYLSSKLRFGPVLEGVTSIASAIGAHRETVTLAFRKLISLGKIPEASSTIRKERAAPVRAAAPAPPSPEFVEVWDHLQTFQRTIREPLNDGVIKAVLEMGRAWGKDAHQTCAGLYDHFRFQRIRPDAKKPYSWGYIINGVKLYFSKKAELQRYYEMKERKRSKQSGVVNIAAPPLPMSLADQEPVSVDFEDLARRKSLPRAVGAS